MYRMVYNKEDLFIPFCLAATLIDKPFKQLPDLVFFPVFLATSVQSLKEMIITMRKICQLTSL